MRRVLVCLVVIAGCADRSIATLEVDPVGEVSKDIPVSADIDLLLVIDNSASTRDKQQVFSQNLRRFVEALDGFPSGRPNLHIGVISTTVSLGRPIDAACSAGSGDDGRLQRAPRVAGCMPPDAAFIADVAAPGGGRDTNYSGTLDQALSCIAEIGATGCGYESHLEAIRRALDGRHPGNAGFLRPGAFLAIVILTDEDDASLADPALLDLPASQVGGGDFRAQPMYAYQCDAPISGTAPGSYANCRVRTGSYLADPADYVDFLAGVVPAGRAVVALIGGDPSATIETGPIAQPFAQPLALLPSCEATINGAYAIGRPANRLMDFVSRFGDLGLFRSVCQPDYSAALADIGQLLFTAVSPCLEGDLLTDDLDAASPGLQLDCAVSDVSDLGEVAIPACAMTAPDAPTTDGARPCYWLASTPAACTTTTGLELRVERSAPPAPGTRVRVRCAT